jgi:cytosine/adenosine deaminase-related metal-dependent hydrolase
VVHHDPLHESLLARNFPTRVLERMGWSHSLHIDGPTAVRESHRRTPVDWPWIIHAAEGVDEQAGGEIDVLDYLGCITANTLIVHGVNLTDAQVARLASAGSGVICCPASNLSLFGQTLTPSNNLRGRIALGSDSRMTGSCDLLAELQIAHKTLGMSSGELETMVTVDAARMLRLDDRGALAPGKLADLIVLTAASALPRVSRADLHLVMLGGEVKWGDASLVSCAGGEAAWEPIVLDGQSKLMHPALADSLLRHGVVESGLEHRANRWRAA